MSHEISVRIIESSTKDEEYPYRRRFDVSFDCSAADPVSDYTFTVVYNGSNAPRTIIYCAKGPDRYKPGQTVSGTRFRWTFFTKCPKPPFCGSLNLSLNVKGTDIFTNQIAKSDAQATAVCTETIVTLPAAPEPWQGGKDDIQSLISGEYFRKGSYHTPDTHVADPEGYSAGDETKDGFKNPNLQKWLKETIADLKTAYPSDAGVQGLEWHLRIATDTWGGTGDSQHSGKEGLPAWPSVFQKKTATSTKWERPASEKQIEKICSQLLGAFYNAFFVEKVLGPHGYAMPANTEHHLKHLAKSETNNPPNFGEDVGGAKTFNWCAAAASRSMKNGCAHYGYKVTDQAGGGVYPEHGVRVYNHSYSRTADRQGATGDNLAKQEVLHAVQPGDVLSIRTHTSPPSGHVVTVLFAFDHDSSGKVIKPTFDATKGKDETQFRIWYVSGNANEQVRVDYCLVVNKRPGRSETDSGYDASKDAVPPPESGCCTIISRVFDHQLQPEYVQLMGENLRAKRHITKQPGTFPSANKPGVLEEQSPPQNETGSGTSTTPGPTSPAGTPTAPASAGAAAAGPADVPKGCYLPKEIWATTQSGNKVLANCINCFSLCECCAPGSKYGCTLGKPTVADCVSCPWAKAPSP
jgi:hypothetical protein